jgi:hypothetical protein
VVLLECEAGARGWSEEEKVHIIVSNSVIPLANSKGTIFSLNHASLRASLCSLSGTSTVFLQKNG